MRQSTIGFARLDQIIEENGKDWLHGQLITRIAEGCAPADIARSIGVSYVVIRRYIEENLAEDIALALRARADIVEHQGTKAVLDADVDTVAVARLQGEYLLKLAERLDKRKYGTKESQDSGNGQQQLPQFHVTFIQAPSQQIERVVVSEPCVIVNQEGELL